MIFSILLYCAPALVRTLLSHNNTSYEDEDRFELEYGKMCGKSSAFDAIINTLPSRIHTEPSLSSRSLSAGLSNSQELIFCCICLTPYKEGAVLRDLPCTHTFHMFCIDKWLRMSATCPLCKKDMKPQTYVDDYFI
ncbi:hypothetical protein KP509_10G073300 [Ceratopteris richardii]|nr:hypothetical protein KP509_10G073300 [Ceratopteris richardii]